MANTHTMRFTALPRGLATGRSGTFPALSVHAAFLLSPDSGGATLGDFPAALDWPSQVIDFEVVFGRGTRSFTTPATITSSPLDAALWSSIFQPTLTVATFAPPVRGARRIRTFRNGRLAQRWRDAYVSVVNSVGERNDHVDVGLDPSIGLLAAFETAGFADDNRKKSMGDGALSNGLEAELDANGYVLPEPPPSMSPAERQRRDLLEFRRFLARVVAPDPADTGAEPGDRPNRVSWVKAPQVDFHQVTTALAAHPALLRPLGFVFDLVAEGGPAEISRALGGPPEAVAVIATPRSVTREPAFVVDKPAWTRCVLDERRFVLAPFEDGDLSDTGFLRLGDGTRFTTEILDVEATTLKAIGMGGTIQLRHRRRSRSTPVSESTPTMRASGIGILRTGRSAVLHKYAFQRGDAIVDGLSADPTQVVLDADDVTRGYRLDVQVEGSRRWRSLMRRVGRLDISDGRGSTFDLGDTEGWVSDLPGADDAGDLYLGEEKFRWDGWSLVAPKPGRVIDPEDGVNPASPVPLDGVPVVARYRPSPATLVPLRYGRRYRFRARSVDIAGDGPGESAVSRPDEETPFVVFGRLDAVRSPDLVMTAPRLPGESLDRVVLRTIRRELPADGLNGRHIIAPRTSVVDAERHGVIDTPEGLPDASRYQELALRDAYSLHLDPLAQLDPTDPRSADNDEGASRFVPLEVALPIQYLPDPLARSLQLRTLEGRSILPGTLGATGIALSGASWPADASSIRLVVQEAGAPDVQWSETDRRLVVSLPKAESIDLRLSSKFDDADLMKFAIAEWLTRALPPSFVWPASIDALLSSAVGRRIADGRNWVFTPWRPLTLVHAVKDPLTDPRFDPVANFSVGVKPLAVTASSLGVPAAWHAKSTGRLDLLATWTEGIDRGPGTSPPREEQVSVVVAELPRREPGVGETEIKAPLRARHEHGDTKHRRITYRLEATGAFLAHFTEVRTIQFPVGVDSIEIEGIDVTGIALGTVRLTGRRFASPNASIVTFRREGDPSAADDDPVAYRLTSAPGATTATVTRIGDTLPSDLALTLRFVTNPISHRSNPTTRNVLASSRPAAPLIHSVLPTFGWERTTSGATVTSTRLGSGLRVWLDRPWWSSGLGEQLAVLYRTGSTQPSLTDARFVTMWGRDPLHAASSVAAALTDEAFPLRSAPSVGLRPPGGPIVRAVPHDVRFDPERDKWYCDIDVQLGSYWPFVRLAVARWQPNAIVAADPPGGPADSQLSLSPVVLTDITQVAPGRTATVTATNIANAASIVTVALQGQRSVNSQWTVVEAHVERQRRDRGGDVDWESLTDPVGLVPVALSGPALIGTERREGRIRLLTPRPRDYRYRVIIEEYERYRTDGDDASSFLRRRGNLVVSIPYPRDGRRLVHLDVVPLTDLL